MIRHWQNRTILLVDDEPSCNIIVSKFLEFTGVNIIHAETGTQGFLEALKNPRVNLVLMDIKLPDIDGYEATRLIRKYRKTLPVIAYTALGLEEHKYLALKSGCNDYLAKPVTREEMLKKLDPYLKKAANPPGSKIYLT